MALSISKDTRITIGLLLLIIPLIFIFGFKWGQVSDLKVDVEKVESDVERVREDYVKKDEWIRMVKNFQDQLDRIEDRVNETD